MHPSSLVPGSTRAKSVHRPSVAATTEAKGRRRELLRLGRRDDLVDDLAADQVLDAVLANQPEAEGESAALGALIEAEGLADVDQVQNVLLEAAAPEAHRGVEELGSDPLVVFERVRHLAMVGRGDRVDGGG